MNLYELIEELRDLAGSLPDGVRPCDVEVLCAVQPSYPLAHDLDAVTLETNAGRGEGTVLWLASSQGHPHGQNPYAPHHAWDGGEVDGIEEDERC